MLVCWFPPQPFTHNLSIAPVAALRLTWTTRFSATPNYRNVSAPSAFLSIRELNELRSELQQARRESDRVRRIQDNSAVDLNAMRNRVERRIEQLDFVANLVTDYSQRFERDIDLSEQQIYTAAIERLQRVMEEVHDDDELQRSRRLVGQLFILQEGIGRFSRLLGGDTFEGRAIVGGGQVEEGTFINFGPTTFFCQQRIWHSRPFPPYRPDSHCGSNQRRSRSRYQGSGC
ncbi:MAG: hypothetical protein LR015_10245 [Verrucomicrobia bacterium]|nr:hypothetical protein [Verrucomicrobiota bacterium]